MSAPDLDAYLGFYLVWGIPVFCSASWGSKASAPGDLCHGLFAVYTNLFTLNLQAESDWQTPAAAYGTSRCSLP